MEKGKVLECPFGAEMRECKYQETQAKDLESAIRGDIVSLCTLTKPEDCPKLKEIFEGGGEKWHQR